ncbi:hypothetical protein BEP19_03275 [Ammoniphilus oxalaticus]|uniref:DUF3592 domain-containing protein n=2 Tax=Ammoniphilus oxalaticus TaxID=66863 RepID=A0A419SNS8_9BACL|nr:hypothetical protein BEP19_03275 [Ammoniphilus oxalaticus]
MANKEERWEIEGFILFVLMIVISVLLSKVEGKGQFLKFLFLDVLFINLTGVFMLVSGLALLGLGLYLIFSKKAADPKKLTWVLPLFLLLWIGLGIGLLQDIRDNLLDVGNYIVGNIAEEEVVIVKFKRIPAHNNTLYEYTFSDGRQLVEKYSGKGFAAIQEGATYRIRYLPRSQKLLNIHRVD